MTVTSMGIELALDRGQRLEVLSPVAARFRYGTAVPDEPADGRFALSVLETADMAALGACLAESGLAFATSAEAITVPPNAACGAGLVFVGPISRD